MDRVRWSCWDAGWSSGVCDCDCDCGCGCGCGRRIALVAALVRGLERRVYGPRGRRRPRRADVSAKGRAAHSQRQRTHRARLRVDFCVSQPPSSPPAHPAALCSPHSATARTGREGGEPHKAMAKTRRGVSPRPATVLRCYSAAVLRTAAPWGPAWTGTRGSTCERRRCIVLHCGIVMVAATSRGRGRGYGRG